MENNGYKIKTELDLNKKDNMMINRIGNDTINLEKLCDCSQKTYYGTAFCGTPLFCSYGQIGYSFTYNNKEWKVDYELNEINISM